MKKTSVNRQYALSSRQTITYCLILTTYSLVLSLMLSFCSKESSGVSTQICTQSVTSGFEVGKKNNTSLTPHGITLSPEVIQIEGINEPYVWAIERDRQGQIYLGTGDPGSVYVLELEREASSISAELAAEASGGQGITVKKNVYKPRLLFRSTELHVHTLAISPSGEIYAGTSPQGHVYAITPQGEARLFCALPANYIWKLVFDERENIYAATGPDGIIYKISREGNTTKTEVFFDSSETHLLDLILDKESNLYACSEPNGIIYKITPSTSGGQAFVLYDAEEGEVHCLAMDSLGQLYAGTAAGARPRIPVVPTAPVPPIFKPPASSEHAPSPVDTSSSVTADDERTTQETPPTYPVPEAPRPREPEKPTVPPYQLKITNFVYKISPNGTVKKVLEVPQALVLCLSVDSRDNVLVGTGSEARIYEIDSKGESCTLLEVDETQVLCLLSDGQFPKEDEGFFFGTGNTGLVFQASNTYCQEGSFESEVFDTKFITAWGNLSWEGDVPHGTKLTLSTRTGNSRKPDITWSPWSEEYEREGKIQSPAARFIQYRARLITSRLRETPLLQRVFLAYLPQNQAPDILSLSVSSRESTGRERFPRVAPPGRESEETPRTSHQVVPRPGINREIKYIGWKAADPNGDAMRYQLFYKGRNEKDWKPVTREEIKGEPFNWQTTRVPDGEYLVKLVVSDEPDNPPDITLSTEKVSEPFLVDNTRPLLLDLKTVVNNKEGEVSGLARDELSNISRVEYSIDAGDWKAIFPKDNIFDSREEEFQFTVKDLSIGEHTIVINATDAEGNIGSGKIVFELR